jgi:hypothetical protein
MVETIYYVPLVMPFWNDGVFADVLQATPLDIFA